MRVAHVITRLIIGGAQENTILNCQDLIHDFGDEVVLITGPGIGPEGSLEDDARRRGVPLEIIPAFRRAIHPWRDWRSYREIIAVLRQFQPDVVHTHSGKAGLLGRMAAPRLGVPAIVHTIHGAPFHKFQNKAAREFFRRCEMFAAPRCHAMISVADAMTDQLVAAGVAPREQFTTIYSGMEIEPFLEAADKHRTQIRCELGYGDEHIVVGKIARLFHLKGHNDLIAAAHQACERLPQLRFLLVGDGVLRPALEARIAAAGLADRFHLTGLVRPERIPELIAATDLVVHTSLREGLARVLPQAMLASRPVISYDVDGAREVVLDGETGYLVQPGDVTALADRICQLASSSELRHAMSARGRELCIARFEHHSMTEQIRALYLRVLQRSATVGEDQAARAAHNE